MHHRQGLDIDTDIFILISHKIIVRTPPKYNYLPALNLKKKKTVHMKSITIEEFLLFKLLDFILLNQPGTMIAISLKFWNQIQQ